MVDKKLYTQNTCTKTWTNKKCHCILYTK